MNKIHALRRWMQNRLSQDESGFTLVELLMAIVISGIIVGGLASAFLVGVKTTSAATTRLDESHDAQLASAYFVADASSAASFSQTAPAAGSCAAGLSNVVSFQWTDSGVAKSVYYVITGSPSQLVRRYCQNDVLSSDVTLVKNLASTLPTASCPPPEDPSCGVTGTPADVQLQVQETSGYTYTLRASPRVNSSTGGGLGGYAVYVGGGGVTLKGNSTISAATGIVAVTGGADCNSHSSVTAPDGFYGSDGGSCSPTAGSPPPDPLGSLPDPTVPGTAASDSTHPNSTTCGSSMRTYQPGHYTAASSLSNGCLASGVYYFDKNASLDGVTSAAGGVLIYMSGGDLSLDGTTTLSPMTTGSDAGVTIFMGRRNSGTISTNSTMTINGVTYAPAGELDLQSNNSNVTSGGINVSTFQIKGNGSGLIIT